MERIPPEVLQMIIDSLTNPNDLYNAYKTCTMWRDILSPTKTSWLFQEALQNFVLYLRKSDVLQCRNICKTWRYGVDHFLENNATVRPTFEATWQTGSYKTDLNVRDLQLFLEKQEFVFGRGQQEDIMPGLDRMLTPDYPNSYPIVGRSLEVFWSPTEHERGINDSQAGRFLCAFGKHIWFLSIIFTSIQSLDVLKIVFDLRFLAPNLKKLSVVTRSVLHGPISVNDEAVVECVEKACASQRILKFNKLEALDIRRIISAEVHQILLGVLNTNTLTGLYIGRLFADENLNAENIVDFSLQLDSYPGVLQALKMQSPVRRLSLTSSSCSTVGAVFRVAKHFRATLRSFCIEINAYHIGGKPIHSYLNTVQDESCLLLEPLCKKEMLLDFPQLKSVTLKRILPVSLNFLCALRNTLEYLHISRQKLAHIDKDVPALVDKMMIKEEFDLLDYLRQISDGRKKKRIMYNSNIWKVFPKLRVLSVEILKPGDRNNYYAEFRRDVYEKITR